MRVKYDDHVMINAAYGDVGCVFYIFTGPDNETNL